jgi:hypothetical protein
MFSNNQPGYIVNYSALTNLSITKSKNGKKRKRDRMNVTQRIEYLQKIESAISRIVAEYDFLIVVEHMDESIVAMQYLTGLSITDFLVLSSKLSGSYYNSGNLGDNCIKLN